MSDLYLIFDGYHLQSSFHSALKSSLDWTSLRQTRNAFAEAVRQRTHFGFEKLDTLFVSAGPGDIPNGRVRDLARNNERAMLPTADDERRCRWIIDRQTTDLVVNPRGKIKQQE